MSFWLLKDPCVLLFTIINHSHNAASIPHPEIQGSEKAFDECLGVSNIFPSAAEIQIW